MFAFLRCSVNVRIQSVAKTKKERNAAFDTPCECRFTSDGLVGWVDAKPDVGISGASSAIRRSVADLSSRSDSPLNVTVILSKGHLRNLNEKWLWDEQSLDDGLTWREDGKIVPLFG